MTGPSRPLLVEGMMARALTPLEGPGLPRLAGAVATGMLAAALGSQAGTHPLLPLAAAGGLALAVLALARLDLAIYLLIAGIPLENLALVPGAGVSALRLVILVIAAAWGVRLALRGFAGLRLTLSLFFLAAFVLFSASSLVWATDPGFTVLRLQSYASGMALYLVLLNELTTRPRLFGVFRAYVAFSAASAVLAVVQFVQGGASETESTTRSVGLFVDPNFFAMAQGVGACLAVALMLGSSGAAGRLLWAVAAGAIALSAALSMSRGSLAALAVGAVVLLLAAPSRRVRLQLGALLLAAALLVAVVAGEALAARIERLEEDRAAGRETVWQVALQVFREHPVAGVGAGNFIVVYLDALQRTPGVPIEMLPRDADTEEQAKVAHNTYLSVLSETGLVGLGLFLPGFVLSFFALVRARWLGAVGLAYGDRALAASLLAAWTVVAVASIGLTAEGSKIVWVTLALTAAGCSLLRPAAERGAGP